jgi:ATP-dependent DNA helicase RecG
MSITPEHFFMLLLPQLSLRCIEFKESLEISKPKSWLKTVSAFANTVGGGILWGVSDDRKIIGISDAQHTIEKISEIIRAKIEPMLIFRISPIKIDGKTIIRLDIKLGATTPYYYVNDGTKTAYFRLGNESLVAPAHILNELILKGKRLSYDAMTSNIKFSDVSFTLFEATFKQRTRSAIERNSDYLSFGLVDENQILTNAGVLLSDQCLVLQSRIFCTRWNGLDKGSIFEDAIDDKEYSGNLISLLDNGLTFVKNNSKIKWKKTATGRDEMPDYPERAVFEAIVNALIHRDYMILGSEVHIDMYDDRLEITSPGGMFDGKRIQEIDILHVPSSRRNPVISDVFHRLKYMERRGSGIKKILKEYEDNDLPQFYSDQHYFVVTLINKNFYNDANKKSTVKSTVKSSEKILEIVYENQSITILEIAELIGISKRAVEKQIAKLKDEGVLKRVGRRNYVDN